MNEQQAPEVNVEVKPAPQPQIAEPSDSATALTIELGRLRTELAEAKANGATKAEITALQQEIAQLREAQKATAAVAVAAAEQEATEPTNGEQPLSLVLPEVEQIQPAPAEQVSESPVAAPTQSRKPSFLDRLTDWL